MFSKNNNKNTQEWSRAIILVDMNAFVRHEVANLSCPYSSSRGPPVPPGDARGLNKERP